MCKRSEFGHKKSLNWKKIFTPKFEFVIIFRIRLASLAFKNGRRSFQLQEKNCDRLLAKMCVTLQKKAMHYHKTTWKFVCAVVD